MIAMKEIYGELSFITFKAIIKSHWEIFLGDFYYFKEEKNAKTI